MNAGDDREEALFREVLQRDRGSERDAFLDKACAGNPSLRARLAALLQAHDNPDPFLEPPSPLASATTPLPPVEGPGTVIGRYKLLQQIGEGGCGVVYMAEQEEPVRRRVALKIIKLGMDTKQVIARFEVERQALAMMDHPNIARILDAGATETGRPYFVMELVRGVRITEYCDQNNLPTADRLQLFMQICLAVQHAHQKGVIHRDIKPSNILVSLHDDVPVPKVIDFGIAKAIGERLTDKTVFTRFEQFIGTPAYMSPEQTGVSGLDIDTRSDIYALGILLYELLTGRTPFDPKQLAEAGLDEILRRIREEEPPRPSTRLSTLQREELTTTALRRQIEPPKLISLMRGDLDWIVMKCLEKNRARRYETANTLIEDIQRHLSHEPVRACPPSAAYRAHKFVWRHRFGVTMAVALTVALAAGLAAALIGFEQARRERDRAERLVEAEAEQRDIAEANYQTARAAVDQMLNHLATDLADKPRMTQLRRQLLEDALKFHQRFLQQKANDPELRLIVARTYLRMGQIYTWLGQYEKSLQPFGQALAALEELARQQPQLPQYRVEMANAHAGMSYATMWLDRAAETVAHRRQVVLIYEELQREFPNVPEYLSQLARAHVDLANGFRGRPKDNLPEMQQALTLYGELRTRFPNEPEDPVLLSHIRHWLGKALEESGRLEEAEQQYRMAHELRTQLVDDQPRSGQSASETRQSLAHIKWYLGELLARTGRFQEAEKLIREGIGITEKNLEDDPDFVERWRQLGNQYDCLGRVLLAMQRTPEAEAALRHGAELHASMARLVPGEPVYPASAANSLYQLGTLLQATGRSEEAAEAFRNSIATYEKLAGEHPDSSDQKWRLAWILATCPMSQLLDPSRAATLARQAVQLAPELPVCWTTLGVAQYRLGEPAAAVEALLKAMELEYDGNPRQWLFLAMAHSQTGNREQARLWYDKTVAWIEKYHPADETLDRFRTEAELVIGK